MYNYFQTIVLNEEIRIHIMFIRVYRVPIYLQPWIFGLFEFVLDELSNLIFVIMAIIILLNSSFKHQYITIISVYNVIIYVIYSTNRCIHL